MNHTQIHLSDDEDVDMTNETTNSNQRERSRSRSRSRGRNQGADTVNHNTEADEHRVATDDRRVAQEVEEEDPVKLREEIRRLKSALNTESNVANLLRRNISDPLRYADPNTIKIASMKENGTK
eukprot:877261_1